MDLQTLIFINPMFRHRGLLQLTRKFACHVVLSCIVYFLVVDGLLYVSGAQNSPDYDACSSFEKSYHFDSPDTTVSDSRLGHEFPAAHNSFENVCPNSHLFCFPSLLDGFFRKEKVTKDTVVEESGTQYKSPLCVELGQDSRQASNKSWSSDFGVFRLLSGGVISCSLNSKEGVDELPSLQSEIGHKHDISSCGGSLSKLKSTHTLPKSSEVPTKLNSLDGSVSPNIKVGPIVLDWGQKYIYSSSASFLTVENTCNESTLHLYEPFSTDLQFYPCNFSEVSLRPGESVIICFVFFPKSLGFSSASLILQTSSGGFVVEAKGYGTESPFGIQPFSGVEISPGGRLSRNFSLFNPFDEQLYVNKITAWISTSLGDNSVETEGICSVNDFQVFDTHPSPTFRDRLVVKNSQIGSPIVAIRPHRKWDIGPHSSETIFEIDITVGFEGKIFGAICLHLLRSSQDLSDSIMVPIEAEVDTAHSASDTVGNFVSATLEGVAACDSGEIAITISLRNDASHILSFVKVLEVADVDVFHIKYKEDLLLFPGSVTQVGIIYCSHHLHLDSPKVADLRENCKLTILTNDSTSPLILIPCEDILYICFENHKLSSAGVEDKSKHIEARNIRAGYVGRSMQMPPNVNVLSRTVDELVLKNWKSQGTTNDMSVLEDREVLFPMIQVGSYVSRWITVKNPSQHPVTMQLILNSGELINECKGLHDLLNTYSSGNLVVDEGANPTKFGFSVPENALTEAYVHPYDRVTLGPIIFYPSDRCSWSGSVLVRNNLSGVESVLLRGFGGSVSLVLLDESSEQLQDADFDLKMPKPFNFSLPYSLLNPKEMTSLCSQPLVKKLYAKNMGDLPLEVKSIRVSGRECGLDGFKILYCRGFTLEPDESIKLMISYQTDFSAAVVHRDLELALDTGIFLLPMKASFSHDMLSNCKKSMFWTQVKKALFGFLLIASLLYLVFWFVSSQSTALDSLDFSGKSDDNLVHTTAVKSGGKTPLLDHNQRKSKLSVTNKINHIMEASCCSYSYGQGNPSEHGISQHRMQTSENHLLPDTQEIPSSEQMKASESSHLVVKTGKEKVRRKKRKNLGAKLAALSEVSSSQSGNSTPSSPLSPVSFAIPKYNWPLSSDVEQPLETLGSTSVATQHSAKNQGSVLKPATANATTTTSSNITVKLRHTASPFRAGATTPSSLSSECTVSTSHARAPGPELHNQKDVGAQDAGLAAEYEYDIWGDHFSLPHLLVSMKNVTHVKHGPANNNSFDSFFVRGPQTLVTNSQLG